MSEANGLASQLSTLNIQLSTLKPGRHDACVAVRAVAVVEAMAALVL